MVKCNIVNCEYQKKYSGACKLTILERIDCCPSIRMRKELGLSTFKSKKRSQS